MSATEPTPPPNPPAQASPVLGPRLWHALGPVLGGLVLDLADLVTLGGLGLWVGFPVGVLVGWWIASFYSMRRRTRVLLALAAGLYCMLPFTSFLPLATLVGACGRFLDFGAPQTERRGEATGPDEQRRP